MATAAVCDQDVKFELIQASVAVIQTSFTRAGKFICSGGKEVARRASAQSIETSLSE